MNARKFNFLSLILGAPFLVHFLFQSVNRAEPAFATFDVICAVWDFVPFIIAFFMLRAQVSKIVTIPLIILFVVANVLVHKQVFYSPGSSTDALALLFLPLWLNLLALIVWVGAWLTQKKFGHK